MLFKILFLKDVKYSAEQTKIFLKIEQNVTGRVSSTYVQHLDQGFANYNPGPKYSLPPALVNKVLLCKDRRVKCLQQSLHGLCMTYLLFMASMKNFADAWSMHGKTVVLTVWFKKNALKTG